jgi:hypothetical protein
MNPPLRITTLAVTYVLSVAACAESVLITSHPNGAEAYVDQA